MTNYVLEVFEITKGISTGHFLLSSGLHSEKYLQCAQVLQHPLYARALGSMIGECFYRNHHVHVVISPAIGGIVIGHLVAESLRARAIFAERVEGIMELRRGFSIKEGERVLIVEDVITTGNTILELIRFVLEAKSTLVGIASIIDRSNGLKIAEGVKQVSLLTMDIPTYASTTCPLCAKGVPLEKPGSKL